MNYRSTILAVVALLWILLGLLAFVAGEFLLAGFCLLATSFTIFLRERRV